MRDIYSSSRRDALAPNRRNSLPCTVRTFRQKSCIQSIGCLLCIMAMIYDLWDRSLDKRKVRGLVLCSGWLSISSTATPHRYISIRCISHICLLFYKPNQKSFFLIIIFTLFNGYFYMKRAVFYDQCLSVHLSAIMMFRFNLYFYVHKNSDSYQKRCFLKIMIGRSVCLLDFLITSYYMTLLSYLLEFMILIP